MKLYSLPLSPFAARVRGALYAKGLAAEMLAPPESFGTSSSFRKVSPTGRIPVLVRDDGTTLVESGVIVEYLEDAFPEPSLRPKSAEALAQVRLITQVADAYVMNALMPLFALFDTKEKDTSAIEAGLARLDDGLGKLDALLAPKGYANGERLTTADVWLTPIRFSLDGFMAFAGRKEVLAKHPRFAAYRDVIEGDPALGRVWREMNDGLKAFMESRASAS
ncbi:MAG: glutathione S-transferase [Labilithrix sp.]|nr:glutathione S-transferase [Labilithrix sp.]